MVHFSSETIAYVSFDERRTLFQRCFAVIFLQKYFGSMSLDSLVVKR